LVQIYNGILFSCKKENNADTCYNIDEPRKHYDKWGEKPDIKGYILYDSIYRKLLRGKSLELESTLMVPKC
jgi:hypothetical protein